MTCGYRVAEPADHPAVARLSEDAFGIPADAALRFVSGLPAGSLRVAGEPVAGCAVLLPMRQACGGRAVAAVGLQAVAVGPEARGSGLGRALVAEALREIAASGAAVAPLFASVQPLYRSLGWEQSGLAGRITLRLRELPRVRRARPVVALEQRHEAALRALADEMALRHDGCLLRTDYLWSRIRRFRGVETRGWGVPGPDGRLDASAFVAVTQENGRRELLVPDLAFRTPEAGEALLAFLADFAPTVPACTILGGPLHPVALLLPQQWRECAIDDAWLQRIVSLPQAIAQRGYPTSISTSFRLRYDDPILPRNSGDWAVRVHAGRAEAQPAGPADQQPLVQCGPRGFAAVWSGFLAPHQARDAGLLAGEDDALESLRPAFAGPVPWMTDRF